MSTHYLASNQLRLWLATLAYLLVERVRAIGLAGPQLARATAGSVRLKLLKVAACAGERVPDARAGEPHLGGAGALHALRAGPGLVVSGPRLTTTNRRGPLGKRKTRRNYPKP